MKKVYLAGKITGLDYDDVVKAFNTAEEGLLDKRYVVVNPIKLVSRGMDWNKAMRTCIKAMMSCDAIALLPGWSDSRGVSIEYEIAEMLDFEFIYL